MCASTAWGNAELVADSSTPTIAEPAPRAFAPSGTYCGQAGEGVSVFRGIRYAEPPIGPLRFAPPVPAVALVGEIDATVNGPISIQDIDPLPVAVPKTESGYYAPNSVASEDCLNLSVWTPDISGRAPVFVWIHGGGFLVGSGTALWTDGARLARENGIVVVCINYRLGYLGSLFLGDYEPQRSNLALQDMVCALQWVKENISAFGGDPERVTVGGQSAGGMAVASLLVAPGARGLFRRAFVESGHLGLTTTIEDARETTRALLDDLAIDREGDVLEQLRQVSTFRILAVQRRHGLFKHAFPTVADGIILPSDPFAALATRSDIDLLIGATSEEFNLYPSIGWGIPDRDLPSLLAAYLPDADARSDGEAIYRPLLASLDDDRLGLAQALMADHGFVEPARRIAITHSANGGRTYVYEFAWDSPGLDGGTGAAHGADIPFFFNNLDAPGVSSLLGEEVRDESVLELARNVSGALGAFVRTGDPSGPLGQWPAFHPTSKATMIADIHPRVEIDRLSARLDFWEKYQSISAPALACLFGRELG